MGPLTVLSISFASYIDDTTDVTPGVPWAVVEGFVTKFVLLGAQRETVMGFSDNMRGPGEGGEAVGSFSRSWGRLRGLPLIVWIVRARSMRMVEGIVVKVRFACSYSSPIVFSAHIPSADIASACPKSFLRYCLLSCKFIDYMIDNFLTRCARQWDEYLG